MHLEEYFGKLSKLTKFSNFFGFPFVFQPLRIKRFTVSSKLYARGFNSYVILLLYAILLFVKMILSKSKGETQEIYSILPIYYGLISWIICLSAVFAEPHEVAQTLNAWLSFSHHLHEKYKSTRTVERLFHQISENVYNLTLLVTISGSIFCLGLTLTVILFPQMPWHPLALLPADNLFHGLYHCALSILILPFTIGLSTYLITFVYLFTLPIALFNPLIKEEITFRGKWRSRFPHRLREWDELSLLYRMLQIVRGATVVSFGPYLIPIQTICGQLTILSFYQMILHHNEMDWISLVLHVIYATLPSTLYSLLLVHAGAVYLSSKRALGSWNKGDWGCGTNGKYMRRFVKSCPPLYAGYPGYFKITQDTCLKFVRGTIVGLFRALKMLK